MEEPMPAQYWLVKSEPFKYPWDQLVDDGRTFWDGVRNYEARNNLRAMRVGDLVLYYHSNEGKEVVGVARVVAEAYPDPTTDDDAWVVVDLEALQRLDAPVSLAAIKGEAALSEIALVKRGRISVVPITPAEFERVLAMGHTVLRPDAVPEKLPPREPPERRATARGSAAGKSGKPVRKKAGREASAPARSSRAAGRQATGSAARPSKKSAKTKKSAPKKKAARRKAAKTAPERSPAPARRRK
jgi:predicted RNA-binding protein with PUA-like domain